MILNFSAIDRNSLLGRVIRSPLRLIPKEARIPILQGKLRGTRWIVESSNHGCWLGSYERGQQGAFGEWVKDGDVVFDIGAHVGFYTLLGSILVGNRGWVVAFEPVPRNLRYLKKHLQINAISNVEVFELAVSDRRGDALLSTGPSSSMWTIGECGELAVQTARLDELVLDGTIPAPDVIKMDVEGAEFLALTGSSDVIDKYHPTLFLSTHGTELHRKCCNFLEKRGYSLTSMDESPMVDSREVLAVHDSAG